MPLSDVPRGLPEKYVVEGTLGSGAMGIIVKAFHTGLELPVAIKVLSPEALTQPDAIARFLREARATASLVNDHVVRVYDVDRLPSGEPYIVMDRLEGMDLDQVLEVRGPQRPRIALGWVLEACRGVSAAHERGIVHRDLKPSNLFLARVGRRTMIKVLDFGVSKVLPSDAEVSTRKLTTTRQLIGSPVYMAPEQFRTPKDVDHRCDVWALGVILFELLTGRLPFERDTLPQVMASICMDDPTPIEQLRRGLPEGVRTVVRRCLEKRRQDRWQSADDLAGALEALLQAPNGVTDTVRLRKDPDAPPASGPVSRRVIGGTVPLHAPRRKRES